jgi:4-amino-4-deoxy-L-arabinose transferase-like glycosyltransferase
MYDALGLPISDKWETRTRILFYIVGMLTGGILTYTTRHFINGDAINYIEMGEALRFGNWQDFVNFTASPGYAALLGLGQILLNTDRANEIPLLKTVNFGCMIVAMWACDLLLRSLKKHYTDLIGENETPLPWFMIMALAYGMFLFCALAWVRPRLVAPEMAVLAVVLLSMTFILDIRRDPTPYGKFCLLGLSSGIAYLLKTFFFPFSVFFFLVAGLACGSIRKAIPRVTVSVVIMLLVCSPWLLALSSKLGHLSYGETGSLNYGIYVKAEGESIHSPVLLTEAPQVLLYQDTPFENSTRPATFDPSYWKIGIKPVFDLRAHARLFVEHICQISSDQPGLFLAVLLWLVWSARIGSLKIGRFRPLSVQLCLALPAIIGIAMYSIIHVEMRYLAPFMFFIFVALVLCPRHNASNRSLAQKSMVSALIPLMVILGSSVGTVVDQSLRSLVSTGEKISHKEAFCQMMAVRDYLKNVGVEGRSQVALVGIPPSYWGRMAGVKISAEIPKDEEILSATPEKRKRSVETLRSVGVNTVVAKGKDYGKLMSEGWELVPGTMDYYVYTGKEKPWEPSQMADLREGSPVAASAPAAPSVPVTGHR